MPKPRPPILRIDTQTHSLQMLLTHDIPSQALQASQAVSRRLDLGFSPRLCSFPADRVPWGRENGTTMMQPSSDQANTKNRGCELPGDKTILPQPAHGEHDKRTWRQRGLAVWRSATLERWTLQDMKPQLVLFVRSSRHNHALLWGFRCQMRLAEALHSRSTSGVAAPAADWVLAHRPRLGTS